MICRVKLIAQRAGMRKYMADLEVTGYGEDKLHAAAIADKIESWNTVNNVDRVTVGKGGTHAKLYITTSDPTLTAVMLRQSIVETNKILQKR